MLPSPVYFIRIAPLADIGLPASWPASVASPLI
nr:MAG TPA: hypothetical protein [Caudoviricetes sp.]